MKGAKTTRGPMVGQNGKAQGLRRQMGVDVQVCRAEPDMKERGQSGAGDAGAAGTEVGRQGRPR